MLLYEAISGRDEYEVEQRADAASEAAAASLPSAASNGTAAAATPASGGE
ncbi:MAG: hypothetical protein WDN30_15655 [Pararobbsia sp.]